MMDICDKPVWLLTSKELDLFDDQERQRVLNHISYLKDTGTLALLSANPPGTIYETIWDRVGGWKLNPVCRCDRAKIAERYFIDAYMESLATPSLSQPACGGPDA